MSRFLKQICHLLHQPLQSLPLSCTHMTEAHLAAAVLTSYKNSMKLLLHALVTDHIVKQMAVCPSQTTAAALRKVIRSPLGRTFLKATWLSSAAQNVVNKPVASVIQCCHIQRAVYQIYQIQIAVLERAQSGL